ncbi:MULTISPECIES: histidine phosphatase family protein [Pseudofrankia]|uniref:histidine phosphatase family protein n=1 Tax=Pseudofrankia TaxID=2994363 RepID=UPI000234BEB2|nr:MULTISPECIES: histidine phosphatase family protein [Pseudofrankia]OHV42006.1 phosphoglycerate mutase [Pseudofrankia sp. EUN1h]
MGVIYLVRHGQASFGSADYDVLSELGYRQAALVGAELRARGARVDLAVSGALRRQRETAAAAGWSADVESDSRWNEYDQDWIINRHADVGGAPVNAGQLPPSRGMSSRAYQGLLDVALSEWIASADAGPGSYVAFSDAVGDALDGLLRRLDSGAAAVVFSSAGPIAAICARLLDLRVDGIISLNRVMINGSITKVVSGRSGTSLISFNEHSHIDAAGREFLSYR